MITLNVKRRLVPSKAPLTILLFAAMCGCVTPSEPPRETKAVISSEQEDEEARWSQIRDLPVQMSATDPGLKENIEFLRVYPHSLHVAKSQSRITDAIATVKDQPWRDSNGDTREFVYPMAEHLFDCTDKNMVNEIGWRALREGCDYVQRYALYAVTDQDLLVEYATNGCNPQRETDAIRRITNDTQRARLALVPKVDRDNRMFAVSGIQSGPALTSVLASGAVDPVIRSIASCKLAFLRQFSQR